MSSLDTSSLFDTVIVEGPPKLNQTLWPDHCIQGSDGKWSVAWGVQWPPQGVQWPPQLGCAVASPAWGVQWPPQLGLCSGLHSLGCAVDSPACGPGAEPLRGF